jgi:(2Fe-2S) ferredoxin
VRDRLKAELKARGIAKIVRANNAGCLDQCARGVSMVVYPEQVWYGGVTVDDIPEIVDSHLVGGKVVERLLMPDQPHVDRRVHLPVLKVGAMLLALALARTASADPPPPEPKPDPIAQSTANDANLESNAPRQGVTVSATVGPGLLIANHTVGTSGSVALRLGHVATPTTILQLEIIGSAYPHTQGMVNSPTLVDTSTSFLIGAQQYVGPSLWLHLGGGINNHVIDQTPLPSIHHIGVAAVGGGGLDIVRRHLWVLGLEVYGILAVNSTGALFNAAFALTLSHY